jgi:predicted transposase YbfD/YdcC
MDEFADFFKHFSILPDPRVERGKRHKLIDVLFIGLASMLSDGETFSDMEEFGEIREEWLRKYLELPRGIPSEDTFQRVFAAIDPKAFADCLMNWTEAIQSVVQGQVIALDGKTIRRSFDRWSGKSAVHVVSAWCTDLGLALGHEIVDSKSNEIPAILALLEKLSVKDRTVTIDAMGCQKDIADKITEKGGDYLLCVKGNQPRLQETVKDFFDDCGDFSEVEHDYFETLEKVHGRIETRKCWVVEGETGWQGINKEWKRAQTMVRIEATRKIREKTSTETRYYISSLPGDAEKIALIARSHWGIENGLHWVLDVIMNEDMSRARKDNAAANLATMRRVAINMAKRVKGKSSIRGTFKKAGWNTSFLERIFAGPE